MPVAMMRSKLTISRQSVFFQAFERGMSTAQIARIARVSVQYVRRLIARARSMPPDPVPAEDPPRLELVSGPDLHHCLHSRTYLTVGDHVLYCLACDALSLDGGQSWLHSPQTPSIAVLAPRRTGRGATLQRLNAGTRAEPGGPTSHQADPRGLRGGRS